MSKTRVIILFGGRSAEHEVSILSARNIYLALDKSRFEPLLIGIDKQGRWRVEPAETLLAAQGDPRLLRLNAAGAEVPVPVRPQAADEVATQAANALAKPGAGPLSILSRDDVVFPVLHGTYGEDGTVQGLLELADVAYVGPGHLGSAIGMDKDVAKRLLAQAGIPVVPWQLVTRATLAKRGEALLDEVAKLGFPLFVKPANAGSSVGVSKVKDRAALLPALQAALGYDTKALCEAGVDAREIECAVLGNDEPEASQPGEVVVTHADGFYSYEAKYVDPTGSHVRIPADIPAEVAERVRALSIQTFLALELAGLARVDFFLDRKTAALYVNEVNTMPGFTAISMYPKMWEASGLPPQGLISRLIDLAIERRRIRRGLSTNV
ncbi:MAG TPA: D-alanine--D-alanine ligase family protein [Polyangia bacterium]